MRCLSSVLLVLLAGVCSYAADWPQWLGPRRDASSTEKVAAWTVPPKVAWHMPVGEGHSSPIVAGGKVFLHAKAAGADAEEVFAFDAATGKQLWKMTYTTAKFSSVFGNGPRGTPIVQGNKLYTLGVTGVLTCWDTDSGQQVWQVDTLKEFKAPNLKFGVSCSPLIEDNKVLVNVGGKGASIVAFAAGTGEVVWRSQDDAASYSSPIAFGEGAARQVVFLTAQGLVSLNPTDGSVFWRYPIKDILFESSATPVRDGDLIVASSITFGSVAVRLRTKENKPAAEEVWKDASLPCYFSTPVPVGSEQLYMITGVNPLKSPQAMASPQSDLRCVDPKTGKVLWTRPKVGKYHAALLRTGDDKLILLDDAGNLALVDPSPKECRELARAKVCGECWAHPALANGRLYVRDNRELICVPLAP